MVRHFVAAFIGAVLPVGVAGAQTCGTYPYTLTNGTTADASQVMADLNQVLNCGNSLLAPLANPYFTGSVGVGNTSPAAKLDVQVSGSVSQGGAWTPSWLRIGEPNAAGANSGGVGLGYDTSNEVSYLASITPGVAWRPMHVDALTVILNSTSGGSVGIGTTTPSSLLFVNGTAGGTSAYTVTSDARLKTEVQTVTGALELIQRLRGVRYTWRAVDDRTVGKELRLPVGEPQVGFIAQEVAAVVPEAVSVPAAGSDGVYGVKPEALLPILVEAMKQQQVEIKQLHAELAEFRAARAGTAAEPVSSQAMQPEAVVRQARASAKN